MNDQAAAMRQEFERIYATREWGRGSGEGSAPVHTRGYVRMLQQFLRDHQIKSVVDFGCGDWQFSRYIDWSGIHYRGYDVVHSVIEKNRRRFGRPGVEFCQSSGHYNDLPVADLLLVKDVLQHWSNENVRNFLPILKRFPRALITNCVNPHGETENNDIRDGEFRYLDLRIPPFDLHAEQIYSFTNHRPKWLGALVRTRWRKITLLHQTSGISEVKELSN